MMTLGARPRAKSDSAWRALNGELPASTTITSAAAISSRATRPSPMAVSQVWWVKTATTTRTESASRTVRRTSALQSGRVDLSICRAEGYGRGRRVWAYPPGPKTLKPRKRTDVHRVHTPETTRRVLGSWRWCVRTKRPGWPRSQQARPHTRYPRGLPASRESGQRRHRERYNSERHTEHPRGRHDPADRHPVRAS